MAKDPRWDDVPEEFTAEQMAAVPPLIAGLQEPDSDQRAVIEALLGARSFYNFFLMAWPHMDPAHLLVNWHVELLAEEMEAVARRKHREVVFCIPPRSLKTQLMSVAFPAWVWTWFPAAKFITASNEMTLAARDAVVMRRLIRSEWYQRRWGPHSPFLQRLSTGAMHPGVDIVGDQDNKTFFQNTAGGHRFCCTPGSNVTGHGGDFILCDDPHPAQKGESEADRDRVLTWWNEAIPTRLNEPDRGVKLVIQQRVHRSDLAGQCIARGYHKVVLAMEFEPDHPDLHPKDPRKIPGEILHKSRISREALDSLKLSLGPYGTAGQLQQRPAPREGGLFKRGYFRIVDAIPAEAHHQRVRGWDLASKQPEPGKDPDYTVGVLMCRDSEGRFYITHVERFRDTPDKVREVMLALASWDQTHTGIRLPKDPGQAGVAQAEDLVRRLAGYSATAVPQTGDKWTRAQPLAAQAAVGNISLLRGGWNEAFLEELCDFPNGGHDDQVDATATAFDGLNTGSAGTWEEFYRRQAEDNEEARREQTSLPTTTSTLFG